MERTLKFLPINGDWDINGNVVTYNKPTNQQGFPFGEILSDLKIPNGKIKARIKFSDNIQESCGRVIIRYSYKTRTYLDIGINGYEKAYLIDEFNPAIGWHALLTNGDYTQLKEMEYQIEVSFIGNQISLSINDIPLLHHTLNSQFNGSQFGFFAWGPNPIEFEILDYKILQPKIFVIMQYGEPFDNLYKDVIKPICKDFNLDAIRADDIYKPGIILQDIIKEINEAEIVIAEITPANPNVFYELGYSHALNKNTILFAKKGHILPFDIHSFRVIFYDNTIHGKSEVEEALKKHLNNLIIQ